ncbi:hypothetical protein CB0940_00930 [Cercospora beticola]|uniref:Adhesion defective protein 1 n=1 Tax=Cercospora beticola TaxID=122368 RepID=A0A2G5I7I1_CERBT|nr:hypothetical protein CB0940_00930 [Cercospora beticola]PIB00757.1 hypothetical protein CB0940_00930 [Cercospora beticola]WPA96357.1 hypothetical protein RHO25_000964 [Cercospora beticola]CAK1355340.1 unnamed protein product [Cercospora beticola]
MMAAYQPTPGGVHPGMAHGHPGMGPNPGQHMGQPMQMHPGVTAPPHQGAAMMSMQPGATGMGPAGMGGQHPGAGMAMPAQMGGQSMAGGVPNAQALSHMTAQQQMAHQHQFAQMASNPNLAQQHHMMRMRQQQMMAQQAQASGMMQPGMQMNPQLAQLQQHQQAQQAVQGGGQQVQLTPHLQQQQMQMMQQQALQQRQAAQQQHQQSQMAQQMAMQHANSQQSNPGQSAAPNPQAQAANAAAAAQQMRPQSRVANPNEQTPTNQQQHSQQSPAQQGQPQAQQTPQQGQAAMAQPQPQQQQAFQQQRQQQIAFMQRQQAMQARMAQQQQAASAQGGMFILRLMHFNDHLSNFTPDNDSSAANGRNIMHWHSFVEKHFAGDGRLIHSFANSDQNGNPSRRSFEVLRPNVARYFYTYFDSGASSLRLHTEHAREVPHPSGSHQVTCQKAIFSVSYPNGARLEMTGSLQVLYSAGSDLIECLSFQTMSTEEILSRTQIEKVLTDFSPTMSTKASPKMTKNKLPKAQQKLQEAENRITIDHFPKTPKGSMGFTSKVQHFLEIGETMNIMSDLMHAAQEKKMRPEQALEALVAEYDNPQISLPPNGVPQGSRTPSMANMQMGPNGQFSSPNVSHMSLPMNGSPHLGHPGGLAPGMNMNSHTPSPHQSNMAAPPMMPQHSAQGTNSSVASENTSPNLNNSNKRRRSTVKMEGDETEPGNRVKPSPRMSKKQKP